MRKLRRNVKLFCPASTLPAWFMFMQLVDSGRPLAGHLASVAVPIHAASRASSAGDVV